MGRDDRYALEPIEQRLANLPRQLQEPPHHHVERGERHDERFERRRHAGEVVADVIAEHSVQPRSEFGENPVTAALANQSRQLHSVAKPSGGRSRKRPTPAMARSRSRCWRVHSWCLQRLIQDVQLVRLVLKHPLLGADARLQLRDRLRIVRTGNRTD